MHIEYYHVAKDLRQFCVDTENDNIIPNNDWDKPFIGPLCPYLTNFI